MAGIGHHVFVSYSRKDQDYTRKLVEELRERGFEVWIDDRIDFGDRWWKEIDRAIRTCAAFVVVMTPDSEASEWVEREVQLAMREGEVILPLLLRGKGHSILITTQHDDVTDGRMPGEDFQRNESWRGTFSTSGRGAVPGVVQSVHPRRCLHLFPLCRQSGTR